MSRAPRGRDELLHDLKAAGRRLSTATVMFHQAVADRLGLNPTDHKCVDLLLLDGPQTAGELAARYADAPPRGEIVLVVGPLGNGGDEGVSDDAAAAFRDLVAAGAKRRVAASVVARLTGASANELYASRDSP